MDTLPNTDGGSFFSNLGGFLGKAADTALDLIALDQKNKIIGSTYPTGQQNPAAVKAEQQAYPFNWKPWAAGGAFFVGAVVLIIAAKKLSK